MANPSEFYEWGRGKYFNYIPQIQGGKTYPHGILRCMICKDEILLQLGRQVHVSSYRHIKKSHVDVLTLFVLAKDSVELREIEIYPLYPEGYDKWADQLGW